MGEHKSWLVLHQKMALIAALAVGWFLADGIILAPIHEHGHLHWATVEHVNAEITSWNTTATDKVTPGILMAGYETEIVTFLIIYAALFFLSSSTAINFRKYYFHLGLPLAYATWSWVKPLVHPVKDFVMVHEWTAGMRGTLLSEYVVVIAIAWAMLILGRVVPDKQT